MEYSNNSLSLTGENPIKKSIFIWIDILGFSDELNKENYDELYNLLVFFQNSFTHTPNAQTKIISDGILIYINDIYHIKELLIEISKKQSEFILEKQKFLRGGISLGTLSKHREHNEGKIFLSNGLAKAVKIESKIINWPIIGTDRQTLDEIYESLKINPVSPLQNNINENSYSNFNLKKAYNELGKEIFFVDYLENDFTDENHFEYLNLLLDKYNFFKKNKEVKILNKYIWLLRYYIDKFKDNHYEYAKEKISELDYIL